MGRLVVCGASKPGSESSKFGCLDGYFAGCLIETIVNDCCSLMIVFGLRNLAFFLFDGLKDCHFSSAAMVLQCFLQGLLSWPK